MLRPELSTLMPCINYCTCSLLYLQRRWGLGSAQFNWDQRGGGGGGGALPLWESVGMRRGFAPHFWHLDDLFAPQNFTISTILFRSCWVPFRSPTFSACRRSFCPPNWPNLSFYSDLVGSRFELRAAHPYWFWPGVPPPPPTTTGEISKALKTLWTNCLVQSQCLGVHIVRRFNPAALRGIVVVRVAGRSSPVSSLTTVIFKLGKDIHCPKISDEIDYGGSLPH